MSWFVSLAVAGAVAIGGSVPSDGERDARDGSVDQSEDGTLNGGGSSSGGKRKDGPKKKGPKRGGKKKGGKKGGKNGQGKDGHKGSKGGKKDGGGKTVQAGPPWGRSRVVVGTAVGGMAGQVREANSDGGRDDVKADGTCGQKGCEPKNTALGFGRYMEVSALYVGKRSEPRYGGPLVRFNRWSMNLEGEERPRPDAAEDAGVLGDVTDRATYSVNMNQLDVGLGMGQKYKPKGPWFYYLEATGAYVWGPMTTTLDSAPDAPIDGSMRGLAWGLQFSHCLSLSKKLHVFLTPMDFDVRYLRAADEASFPFLGDGKVVLSNATAKIGVAGAF